MALGEIKDMAEARHIVRNSFEIKCYEPNREKRRYVGRGLRKVLCSAERLNT